MYMAQMLGAPREMLGAQWQMELNTWSSMENTCLGSATQAPMPGLHSPNPGLDSPSLTPPQLLLLTAPAPAPVAAPDDPLIYRHGSRSALHKPMSCPAHAN